MDTTKSTSYTWIIILVLIVSSIIWISYFKVPVMTNIQTSAFTQFHPMPFEPDNVDCAIKVIKNKSALDEYMTIFPKPDQYCTLTDFKKYFMDNNQYYGEGVWYQNNADSPISQVIFDHFQIVFKTRK